MPNEANKKKKLSYNNYNKWVKYIHLPHLFQFWLRKDPIEFLIYVEIIGIRDMTQLVEKVRIEQIKWEGKKSKIWQK